MKKIMRKKIDTKESIKEVLNMQINILIISSGYLYLFFFPLVELFKLLGAFDEGSVIFTQGIILLVALGITFLMCFLIIMSFYLIERLYLTFSNIVKSTIKLCKNFYYRLGMIIGSIAYPLNLKYTLLHFFVIYIYVFSVRNGIAFCMITPEDISEINEAINQVNVEIFKSMGKITRTIQNDIAEASKEQKQNVNTVIDGLFEVIREKYSFIRSSIVDEKGVLGNGIITKGEHKGKYFMDVIAENNKYWLTTKNKIYYHKLCLVYAQEVAEKVHIERNLESLKQKLILENLGSLKEKLIVARDTSTEEKDLEFNKNLISTQREIIDEKNETIKNLNKNLKETIHTINQNQKMLAQKDLNNKWLQLQVEKNNLINQGHYQYAGMAAMGMGIAVAGTYILSKCI